MDYQQILYDCRDRIATITLNRPDKLNACTPVMVDELIDALDAAGRDDAVRAIIVTGSGRAFCAGADLSNEVPNSDVGELAGSDERIRDLAGRITLKLFDCPKPVIGAINGAAVGVGVTMTLAMDYRLASSDARFGFVFVRRGIVPEGCSTWFLPRIVGMAPALDWMLSGRIFSASEALEHGLVRSVHAAPDLLEAARAIAAEIAQNTAPVSVALTRQMLWRLSSADHPMEAHKIESRGVYATSRSADAREGVSSFLEKRPARFPLTVSRHMPNFYPWWTDRPYG